MKTIAEKTFSKYLNKYVNTITLSNENLTVEFCNYGAMITKLIVNKYNLDIVLGCSSIEEYTIQDKFFGSTIGRYANRIKNGEFSIDSQKYNLSINEPPNHLHGGFEGFHKKLWNYEIADNSIVFSYLSNNLEEGYPGNLSIKVKYTLTKSDLLVEYFATSDRDTIVNLTNHSYFNLNGEGVGDIKNHIFQINSDFYTEFDKESISTGNLITVENTPLNFKNATSIDEMCSNKKFMDYDNNYVLTSSNDFKVLVSSPSTNITMKLYTDYPCMQFFTASNLENFVGKTNTYSNFSAFCLEPQYAPNSINIKSFEQPILKKGDTYSHFIKYEFII